MFKPINIRYEPSKRQAMREIDLNIHYYMYYHPITLMINQHIRREGGSSVGMQLSKSFLFDGGGLAEDIPGSIFWWDPTVSDSQNHRKKIMLLSIWIVMGHHRVGWLRRSPLLACEGVGLKNKISGQMHDDASSTKCGQIRLLARICMYNTP